VTDYDVYCGRDVGEEAHHAVALDRNGKRLHDAALPQDEAKLAPGSLSGPHAARASASSSTGNSS
jgi:hypothetical protein